jgi:acetylcholinesterase
MTLPDITTQQPLFDQLVADTGCTGSADLIACLRTIPLDTLISAVNKAPTFLSFNSRARWQPSVDGHLIVRNPLVSVQKGLYGRFQSLPAIVRMRERKWV